MTIKKLPYLKYCLKRDINNMPTYRNLRRNKK